MRCAARFASSAVTLCAALITTRRFDRSSSSAYMLGHHTKQARSQVCHCAVRNAAAVFRLRRYAVTRRKLLQRVLEEGVFESRLKRTRLGLADPESGIGLDCGVPLGFDVF